MNLNAQIPITIIAAYAPTDCGSDSDKDYFYDQLQACLRSIPNKNIVILLGDLNAEIGNDRNGWEWIMGNFGCGNLNDNGLRLLSLAALNNLSVMNSWFRHKWRHKISWSSNDKKTEKMLDYVLISRKFHTSCQDVRVMRGADFMTDHHLVLAKVQLRLKVTKHTKPTPKLDYSSLSDPALRQKFEIELKNRFIPLEIHTDIESSWNMLMEPLKATTESICPLLRRKTNPWITNNTLNLVDQKKTMKNTNKPAYNRLNRDVKAALKQDREQWWIQQAEEAENAAKSHNTHKLFKIISSVTKPFTKPSDVLYGLDGKATSSPTEKMQLWSDHFHKLLNRPNPTTNDDELDGPLPNRNPYIAEGPPTKEEIKEAVKRLKNIKAPGDDLLPSEAFKAAGETGIAALQVILQNIWDLNQTPKAWSNATIIPIHKKGCKKTCSNYRGISLLPVAGKILTSIIRNRLKPHIREHQRIEQAGFTEGRGCSDQIFAVRRILERCVRYQQPIIIIFVDFSAAFDSIHRPSLWRIMHKIGIPEKLVSVLQNLHSNTYSKVKVNNQETPSFLVSTGVRQGCSIAPVLFNLVIDWILKHALKDCPGVKMHDQQLTDLDYADDIALFAESPLEAQKMLDQLKSAAEKIGLIINTSKTVCLAHKLPDPGLLLNAQTLKCVDTFTYLGAKISSSTFIDTEDINHRLARASTTFAKLYFRLWSSQQISKPTKMKIFNALIIPILLYSSESWTFTKAQLQKLEVFQMRCLRTISGLSLRDRKTNEYIRKLCLNQPTIETFVRRNRMRWAGHVWRMNSNSWPKITLEAPVPKAWKVHKNAPRKTWIKLIEEDLSRIHFNIGDGKIAAQNRKQWVAMVRDACDSTAKGLAMPYRR